MVYIQHSTNHRKTTNSITHSKITYLVVWNTLHCMAVCSSLLQWAAVCWMALQCVAAHLYERNEKQCSLEHYRRVCLLKEARIQLSVAVCVAVCNTLHHRAAAAATHCNTLYYWAANLKYMRTSYTAVHHNAATTDIHYNARCSVLQCVAAYYSVLQRVAACCSVLQCAPYWMPLFWTTCA